MARMIPDVLPEEHSTPGERTVFRHLKHLLPDDFQVFVEPDVRTKRSRSTAQPDFVLFGPDFGLLVLEVKDWTLSQIQHADTYSLKVKFNKRSPESTITNPLRKVRGYCYQVLDQFKQHPILTQQGGPHQGQVCFPFGWAVVFTNINRSELDKHQSLSQLFPVEYTLCRDELSALWNARDDKITLRRFAGYLCKFPFDPVTDQQTETVSYVLSSKWSFAGVKEMLFGKAKKSPATTQKNKASGGNTKRNKDLRIEKVEKPLTTDQSQTVQGVLHPESVVRVKQATQKSVPSGWKLPKGSNVLEVLTAEQEQLARAIGSGHRIFFGVAGSGKTILLLARAKRLASSNPDANILVLCYNNTLLSFLKNGLTQHPNIKVDTFVSWANRYFPLPKPCEQMSDESFATTCLEYKPPESSRYDAILIDEGHDFQPAWFQAAVSALRDEGDGDLMIAIDGSQSLYNRPRKFTWKSVGIKAQGRSRRLADNYRNPRQIFELAWRLTQPTIDMDSDGEINDTHVRVEPTEIKREGNPPRFLDSSKYASSAEAIAQVIASWKKAGYLDRDIAIISRSPNGLGGLMNHVRDCLKEMNIGKTKFGFTRTRGNKRSVIQRESISILSYHSAKGLEFPAVLLLDLEDFSPGEKTRLPANQLYVGMTRAIHELVLFWDQPCWLSNQVNEDAWIRHRLNKFTPA